MAERKISDVFKRHSLRTLIGGAVFALTAIIPAVDTWKQSGPEQVAPAGPTFPNRGFGRPVVVREPLNSRPWSGVGTWAWRIGKAMLAAFGTTLAMLILIPCSGCKRYALLFGPVAGIMASVAVAQWLVGRTQIARFEPVFVAVIAALPAAALWFWCCKRRYERAA